MSPDGSHIAFQRRDSGREEWVMRSDGTDQVKVAADKSSLVRKPEVVSGRQSNRLHQNGFAYNTRRVRLRSTNGGTPEPKLFFLTID